MHGDVHKSLWFLCLLVVKLLFKNLYVSMYVCRCIDPTPPHPRGTFKVYLEIGTANLFLPVVQGAHTCRHPG